MVVSLPLPLAEFNSDKQTAFRAGIASFAGVPVSKVEITVKDENTGNLATSVEVRPSSANQVLTHTHPSIEVRYTVQQTLPRPDPTANIDPAGSCDILCFLLELLVDKTSWFGQRC